MARYGWVTLPEFPFGKKTSSNIKASRKNNITVFFELLAKVEAARFASEAYVLGGRVIGECYGFESHCERYR